MLSRAILELSLASPCRCRTRDGLTSQSAAFAWLRRFAMKKPRVRTSTSPATQRRGSSKEPGEWFRRIRRRARPAVRTHQEQSYRLESRSQQPLGPGGFSAEARGSLVISSGLAGASGQHAGRSSSAEATDSPCQTILHRRENHSLERDCNPLVDAFRTWATLS